MLVVETKFPGYGFVCGFPSLEVRPLTQRYDEPRLELGRYRSDQRRPLKPVRLHRSGQVSLHSVPALLFRY